MDELLKVICRVGIFTICAQALVHFRPKESYEKYFRLLISGMIIFQLLLSVEAILLGDEAPTISEKTEKLQLQWRKDREELMRKVGQADKLLEQMTVGESLGGDGGEDE